MVLLGRRAERVISAINSSANTLRHELLADISNSDLQKCMRVLARIRDRAEKSDKVRTRGERAAAHRYSENNGQIKRGVSIPRRGTIRRGPK
jgi:hypothetical protein